MAIYNDNRAIQVGPPILPLELQPGQDFGQDPMAAMRQRQMAAEMSENFRQGAAAQQREGTFSREAMLRLEVEREKGRQIDARIASQQAKNEYAEDALAGRTSEIDKPAPGTRFTPRYWYGDDTVAKADREAGGRRTIRKIKKAEEAEKAGREERYEKGITSGLKGTEGEYERKLEIYAQMSDDEMNINFGGPRALTKPLYWDNPKTGKKEITEAHKDYDPRKLKPVYYTDNQGRPRVKLKKVGRRTMAESAFPSSDPATGDPIDTRTGRVAPSVISPDPVVASSVISPDPVVAPAGISPSGSVTIPGGGKTGKEDESWIEWAMPGGGAGRSIGRWAEGMLGLGSVGDKSSGEVAAAGDSPQAIALQVTPGERRVRDINAAQRQGVPFEYSQMPVVGGQPGVGDMQSEEEAFRSLTGDLLADEEEVSADDPMARRQRFKQALDVVQPDAVDGDVDSSLTQQRIAEEFEAAMPEGVPFEVGGDPVVGGKPVPPRVFGDQESTFARPGPTEDQLALRAAEKERLKGRGDYAEGIRHRRRMADENLRNAPRFWYNLTGDKKADAAMGVAMANQFGGVLQEQIKGRTAREQMLGQQSQFEQALKFKSQEQLKQIASDPMSPLALQQAARRKYALNLGISIPPAGGAGGGFGGADNAGRAEIMLDAQNPGMMAQLEGAFQAPDGGSLNDDIGGYGSVGDLMENISGWFGGTVRRTNSDQLSYLVENLAGLMSTGQITGENVALVGPIIGAKLDAALKRELGTGGNLSRGGVSWSAIQRFMSDLMAGRMPEGHEGLAGITRKGGFFNRSR